MSIKAGWYKRKSGAIGYWDGSRWTDRVYEAPKKLNPTPADNNLPENKVENPVEVKVPENKIENSEPTEIKLPESSVVTPELADINQSEEKTTPPVQRGIVPIVSPLRKPTTKAATEPKANPIPEKTPWVATTTSASTKSEQMNDPSYDDILAGNKVKKKTSSVIPEYTNFSPVNVDSTNQDALTIDETLTTVVTEETTSKVKKQKPEKKDNSSKTKTAIVVIVLLTLLLLFVISRMSFFDMNSIKFFQSDQKSDTVTETSASSTKYIVPSLIGNILEEAEGTLNLAAFGSSEKTNENIVVQDASDMNRKIGIKSGWTVCFQKPSADSEININEVVNLWVVKSEETCPANKNSPLATSEDTEGVTIEEPNSEGDNPSVLSGQQQANDAVVKAGITNVAKQIETLLIDNPNATNISAEGSTGTIVITVGEETSSAQLFEGVTISITGNAKGYTISGFHSDGEKYKDTSSALIYNSATGGF